MDTITPIEAAYEQINARVDAAVWETRATREGVLTAMGTLLTNIDEATRQIRLLGDKVRKLSAAVDAAVEHNARLDAAAKAQGQTIAMLQEQVKAGLTVQWGLREALKSVGKDAT